MNFWEIHTNVFSSNTENLRKFFLKKVIFETKDTFLVLSLKKSNSMPISYWMI